MSMIDYGAMLKVNGVFINKNKDLLMNKSDTGYYLEKAYYEDIKDYLFVSNYFNAMIGDEDFLICFYKTYFYVISKEKVIHIDHCYPCLSYTYLFNKIFDNEKFPEVKIELLNKNYVYEYRNTDKYGLQNFIDSFGKRKGILLFNRMFKNNNRYFYKYYTRRRIATFSYNENKYECIFGYGIDPNEEVWKEISENKQYDLQPEEIKTINEWFR